MLNKRFFISGLMINALAACSSSHMELSQPSGDWVDYAPVSNDAAAGSSKKDIPAVQRAVNATSSARYSTSPDTTADKNRFVTGSGQKVPLYKAVRDIVPAAWDVRLSPDVAERYRGVVSWTGNDRWPYVLNRALNAAGLEANIDDHKKVVLVRYATPAKGIAPALPAKVAPVTVAHTQNKGLLTPPAVPVTTPPFKQPDSKKPLFKAVPVALPAMPVLKPVAPVKPTLRVWQIAKGATLRQGFESWASKETCAGQGGKWSIRWDSSTDYPIDYPLTFNAADFETATAQLFNLYQRAQVPLYVSGYRQQCLIVISDRK